MRGPWGWKKQLHLSLLGSTWPWLSGVFRGRRLRAGERLHRTPFPRTRLFSRAFLFQCSVSVSLGAVFKQMQVSLTVKTNKASQTTLPSTSHSLEQTSSLSSQHQERWVFITVRDWKWPWLPVYIHLGVGKCWTITQKLKTAFDNSLHKEILQM